MTLTPGRIVLIILASLLIGIAGFVAIGIVLFGGLGFAAGDPAEALLEGGGSPIAPIDAARIEGEELADLGALLEPLRREYELPAIAAAIVTPEGIAALGATGVRVTGGSARVAIDDLFHVGSCAKPMTATLIADLVEEGTLRWEQNVGESFPELEEAIHPLYRGATLEQLLAHRAGLPGDRTPDRNVWPRVRALEGPLPAQREELIRIVMAPRPDSDPGSEMTYANFGYVIAAAMAERATGRSYEELLRERVLTPLGMRSVGFGAPGQPGAEPPDQPRGHRQLFIEPLNPLEPGPRADNPRVTAPGGGLHMSIADFARFARLHLVGGIAAGTAEPERAAGDAVLRGQGSGEQADEAPGEEAQESGAAEAGSRGEMEFEAAAEDPAEAADDDALPILARSSFAKLHADPEDDEYALGWGVVRRNWSAGRALTHTGSNTAFYAVVWVAPGAERAFVAVTNSGGRSAFTGVDAAIGALIDREGLRPEPPGR